MKRNNSISTQRRCSNVTYSRVKKLCRIACACFVLVALMSMSAFAATDITTSIKTGMKSVYTLLCSIVLPIAAVVLAWSAFQIFFGGEKDAEAAKKRMFYVGLAVAIVLIAPLIIKAVGGWFGGTTGNWVL